MLADAFVKAHAGPIKVKMRKSDLFKVKQMDNEILKEFVLRFQMLRMDLLPIVDDWAVQAFTQGLNPRRSVASQQLKQNLVEYLAVTWADELRPVRDRYQPYGIDQRENRFERHPIRNDKRNDQGPISRGLMSKSGFDKMLGSREAPRLSENYFNVDVAIIVSAIGIKETKWRRPLQSDHAKRDPSLVCKYYGTRGHRSEDCQQLREEVARLFNNGHLRELQSEQAKNYFRNKDANKQVIQEAS
nr:uncharacterized protein LOC104092978 [Nicotiana tomentosiformis]